MLLETGKKYTNDQCRQKFNNIRALYKDCKQILSETGVGYNSETGMIELEAERWVRLWKVIKHGKKIKKQGCKNYEQMVRIFGNRHATGKHVHPCTKPPRPHQVLIMPQVATHEAQIHNTEGNVGMIDVERPNVEGPIDLSPTPKPVAKKQKKETFSETMSLVMECLTNIRNAKADKIAKAIAESSSSCQPPRFTEMLKVTSPNKKEKEMDPQLEKCVKIVNTLVGIDDTHYAKIIKMFGKDKVWRDIFLRIPDERKVGIVAMDIRTILTIYDDDDEEEILVLIAAVYEYYYKHFDKQRCRDSMLQGEDYIFEEYRRHTRGPRGEEVYNFRHSSLRNIIEQCFGLVKIRFAILKQMPPYHFDTQVLIVIACCTLHNFIRSQGKSDEIFYSETPQSSQNEPDVDDDVQVSHMNAFMWVDELHQGAKVKEQVQSDLDRVIAMIQNEQCR
ncbi:uncharacterized protein LOC132301124 [Cornus florida]|uniref:uncharacterized protein LOC132301124 n=1 Tax=Cornus florida TaxID=4283 RepID=UPI00289D37F4|nr:uncharacterized protein LOC132301124 [Cornus florida]